MVLVLSTSATVRGAEANPPSEEQLARAAAALPAAAFFGLSNVAQPALSPDGTKIAFLFPHEGRLALGVFDRATNEARMVIRGYDESIASFHWKGNDHLVFFADYHGNESYFIGSTDLSGKKVRRIAESHGHSGGSWSDLYVADWLPGDLEHIVVAGWIGDPLPRVAKLNVVTSKREGLYSVPDDDHDSDYVDFVIDGRAQVRFATVIRKKEVRLLYRGDNTAKFTEVRRDAITGDGAPWRRVLASRDGTKLYVVSYEENDRGSLHLFDPATRKLGPALFIPPEGEIDALIWSSDNNTIVGAACEGERLGYHWFDEQEAAWRKKLEATFPGLEVTVASRSDDDAVRLVWVGSDREPGVYFVFDRRAGSLAQFKRVRDSIDPRLMRPMQPVAFHARDGLELHGYVTRPFGANDRPAPLVVVPHGGPFGVRDSWGFDSEVQFLASRGYAVLQVNFRGSGGYGAKFMRAGRQQWGRAMQDDLTDAVKWAITQRIADPERVAIFGASYGGFAAMAGVTLTPELYRCAINYVGVIDLEITGRQLGADAWMRSDDYDFREVWVGATKEYRDAGNPMRFIERIRVPTLHAYGANDPRASIDHWHRLESELRKFKKPYEIVLNKQAGHGFNAEKDRIAFHEAVEKFLARNLAPSPAPTAGGTQ